MEKGSHPYKLLSTGLRRRLILKVPVIRIGRNWIQVQIVWTESIRLRVQSDRGLMMYIRLQTDEQERISEGLIVGVKGSIASATIFSQPAVQR